MQVGYIGKPNPEQTKDFQSDRCTGDWRHVTHAIDRKTNSVGMVYRTQADFAKPLLQLCTQTYSLLRWTQVKNHWERKGYEGYLVKLFISVLQN